MILKFFFISLSWVGAHSNHYGGADVSQKREALLQDSRIQVITQRYNQSVRPIFKNKCFDCHGSGGKRPWYYTLPIVRQVMNHHMDEAKEHMDMSLGFPFNVDVEEDFKEILEVIEEEEMPPWSYTLMHRDSVLNDLEIQLIRSWIEKSRQVYSSKVSSD